MAHHSDQGDHGQTGHGHGGHGGHDVHAHHPTAKTYIIVGAFLTLITVVEVWAYYVPSFVASKAFVPSLLIMSAFKFVIVVMFYMHLKYDHKLFRALFIGPLVIAAVTMIGLLFLFGQFSIRIGALN